MESKSTTEINSYQMGFFAPAALDQIKLDPFNAAVIAVALFKDMPALKRAGVWIN